MNWYMTSFLLNDPGQERIDRYVKNGRYWQHANDPYVVELQRQLTYAIMHIHLPGWDDAYGLRQIIEEVTCEFNLRKSDFSREFRADLLAGTINLEMHEKLWATMDEERHENESRPPLELNIDDLGELKWVDRESLLSALRGKSGPYDPEEFGGTGRFETPGHNRSWPPERLKIW